MEIILLCLAGFIAAVFDSIAGGGGIITIPALLAAGIPPHQALGTNKFAASWGSFTSSYTFLRSKAVYLPLIKYVIPFTLAGAALGVNTALSINQTYLEVIVLVLLIFVIIYTLIKKEVPRTNNFPGLDRTMIMKASLLGFIIGFYDGFFGPGTGSFLLFAFVHFFKFNYTTSAANARILNFTSNITSLLLFALNAKIILAVGLPMGICMAIGGRIGSKIALKHGVRIIKPIFITMSLLLIIKLFFDYL